VLAAGPLSGARGDELSDMVAWEEESRLSVADHATVCTGLTRGHDARPVVHPTEQQPRVQWPHTRVQRSQWCSEWRRECEWLCSATDSAQQLRCVHVLRCVGRRRRIACWQCGPHRCAPHSHQLRPPTAPHIMHSIPRATRQAARIVAPSMARSALMQLRPVSLSLQRLVALPAARPVAIFAMRPAGMQWRFVSTSASSGVPVTPATPVTSTPIPATGDSSSNGSSGAGAGGAGDQKKDEASGDRWTKFVGTVGALFNWAIPMAVRRHAACNSDAPSPGRLSHPSSP
jgi:hypothetical protein